MLVVVAHSPLRLLLAVVVHSLQETQVVVVHRPQATLVAHSPLHLLVVVVYSPRATLVALNPQPLMLLLLLVLERQCQRMHRLPEGRNAIRQVGSLRISRRPSPDLDLSASSAEIRRRMRNLARMRVLLEKEAELQQGLLQRRRQGSGRTGCRMGIIRCSGMTPGKSWTMGACMMT